MSKTKTAESKKKLMEGLLGPLQKTSSYEEVKESLEDLGLSGYESKIYLYIASHAPMSASAIATDLSLDRTKIYRTVESLVQKGMINQTLENPRLCVIADASSAIDGLIRDWEEKYTNGKKNKDRIVTYIENLSVEKNRKSTQHSHIAVLNTRSALYSHLTTQLKRCKENVFIYTNSSDIMRMYYTKVPEALAALTKSGYQCLIVTDSDLTKISKRYRGCKVVKLSRPIEGRIIVIENELVIMSNKLEKPPLHNSYNDVSLSIKERQIVNNMQHFFKLILNT